MQRRRRASDRAAAPAPPGGFGTKRALLAVRRSLESLASRTMAVGSELTVVALFEDVQSFGYERERYAQRGTDGHGRRRLRRDPPTR